MKFIEKLQYFYDKNKRNELQRITENLPENEMICNEILSDLENKSTKIIIDDDIKNSYYFYLNDTIYLSNCGKSRNLYTRVVLISHECRHSIQNKLLQKLNFIFSNIELLFFIIAIILIVFKVFNLYIFSIYMILVVLSIIPRLILEIDAIKNSLNIANKYMSKKLKINEVDFLSEIYFFQIKLLLPVFIISLIYGRIFRSILIILLYLT